MSKKSTHQKIIETITLQAIQHKTERDSGKSYAMGYCEEVHDTERVYNILSKRLPSNPKKTPIHIMGPYSFNDSNRVGILLYFNPSLASHNAILVNTQLPEDLGKIYRAGADQNVSILHSHDDAHHYDLIHAVGYAEGEEQEQLKEQLPDHIEIKHYAHDDHERLKEDIEAHRSSSDSDDESGDE